MKVLGIAVRVSNRKSTVRLVLLEGDGGADETTATLMETVTVTGDEEVWASHVGNAASTVRGHAKSIRPDVVVVRRADQAPQGRNSDGPKLRLMIEGGIVAACRDDISDVRVLNGRECGKARGTTKDDLDARAGSIVTKSFTEAAAAALSALA